MPGFPEVTALLAKHREDVLREACQALERAHLPHYDKTAGEVVLERLATLYGLLARCAGERHLAPILAYAAKLAEERHAAGFDLGEVQTAINVLEEAVWRAIMRSVPPEAQGRALGAVATILGATKDRLACTYLSLVARSPTRTLDLAELFQGPGEGEAPVA